MDELNELFNKHVNNRYAIVNLLEDSINEGLDSVLLQELSSEEFYELANYMHHVGVLLEKFIEKYPYNPANYD